MDVKKVALLVGALVIAVVTAVMAKNMFTGAGAEQANAAPVVPAGPKVLVARKALPVGTIIDAESLAFQAWPKELVQNAYYTEGAPDADITQADRHGCPQPDHRRPAADQGCARRPERPRLPRRGARPGHARRHGSGFDHHRRRRLHLPGRPSRHGPDPGSRRRRRRPAAQGFRDDRSQPARARHRPAHRQQERGRQDRGQDLHHRHAGSDAAHRAKRSPSPSRWAR